jgi:hypothetical protein
VTDFYRRTEREPHQVAKAATLGLGYVVHMQKTWIPAGHSLGDLVYSLPLAPGEQQRITVVERSATSSAQNVDALSIDEAQSLQERQDTSTLAVFRSAFGEAANGGSTIDTNSRTESASASTGAGSILSLLFTAGGTSGFSSSASSGRTETWQNVSRDFASSAAQNVHGALSRVASASRSASQVSIRLASVAESTNVTTKVITNHNHCHALTMQYWEVLRHFSVTTEVQDVQLVCLVPFELVRFLPPGHEPALASEPARAQLLSRYDAVLRYHDVLAPLFARSPEYAHGLRLLQPFGANPKLEVPPAGALAQEVIRVELSGTFFSFEEVFVTVVAWSGARVGPVRLGGTGAVIVSEQFLTREALIADLQARRRGASVSNFQATVALPDSIARTDVVRLDVTRRTNPLVYTLIRPTAPPLSFLEFFSGSRQSVVSLSPDEIERTAGGPVLISASATIGAPPNQIELLRGGSFAAGATLAQSTSLPTARVQPQLGFADLLRIEAMFQHVVRNTVPYSKAVWAAITAEERAILLERYTIGVPAAGIASAEEEVPLLNCVENRVLGFFGNAAVMPFAIPPELAAQLKVTSRDIQDALLRFHRQGFQPPRSSVTLPARGVLGEAVLGSAVSSEKIDLTRFWNWQDAPVDQADAPPPSAFQPLPAAALAAAGGGAVGSGGSGVASTPPSIITIAGAERSPLGESVLGSLIGKSPDLAREASFTGLSELQKQLEADTKSASEGRKQAIDSVTNLQVKALESGAKIVEAVAEAVASVYGGGKKPGGDGKADGGKSGSGGAGEGKSGGGGKSGSGGAGEGKSGGKA